MCRLHPLDDPETAWLDSPSRTGKLGVIEDVLCLHLELSIHAFIDMRPLDQPHIPVVDPGILQAVAPSGPFDMNPIRTGQIRGWGTFTSREGKCIDIEIVLVAPMFRNRIPYLSGKEKQNAPQFIQSTGRLGVVN